MKKLCSWSLFVLLVLLADGCKKPAQVVNMFTVNNQNGTTKMNIDIYKSLSDFKNSTNVYIHGTADARGTFTFPASKLTVGNWYYVDAYSEDYNVTNWVDDDNPDIRGQDSFSLRRFKYSTGANDDDFMLACQQTTSRLCLLKNNQPGSTWIAYDALELTSNNSIWDMLTPDQQNMKIVVNKDHTGTYYFTSGGSNYYNNFTFQDVTNYPVFIVIVDQTALNMFLTNTPINSYASAYTPTTIDTIQSLVEGNLYLLKRQ